MNNSINDWWAVMDDLHYVLWVQVQPSLRGVTSPPRGFCSIRLAVSPVFILHLHVVALHWPLEWLKHPTLSSSTLGYCSQQPQHDEVIKIPPGKDVWISPTGCYNGINLWATGSEDWQAAIFWLPLSDAEKCAFRWWTHKSAADLQLSSRTTHCSYCA